VVLADRGADEEELMLLALDAGAEDIADDGEAWRITTPPTDLHAVRAAIEEAGIAVSSSELTMLPTATVAVEESDVAKRVLRLMDALDDNDDVQDVYANFDISDELMEAIEA
jgi:transcriptional/translational regulatory protein YebC/TACO1